MFLIHQLPISHPKSPPNLQVTIPGPSSSSRPQSTRSTSWTSGWTACPRTARAFNELERVTVVYTGWSFNCLSRSDGLLGASSYKGARGFFWKQQFWMFFFVLKSHIKKWEVLILVCKCISDNLYNANLVCAFCRKTVVFCFYVAIFYWKPMELVRLVQLSPSFFGAQKTPAVLGPKKKSPQQNPLKWSNAAKHVKNFEASKKSKLHQEVADAWHRPLSGIHGSHHSPGINHVALEAG